MTKHTLKLSGGFVHGSMWFEMCAQLGARDSIRVLGSLGGGKLAMHFPTNRQGPQNNTTTHTKATASTTPLHAVAAYRKHVSAQQCLNVDS